ncbi:hypothetical protein [Streptomyces sp. NPDC051909]|uniref:hypothetical protein n=1 Tax=Streptomyces sp. NPDC051909 TaxID=3154944 RepID=UPI00342BABC8
MSADALHRQRPAPGRGGKAHRSLTVKLSQPALDARRPPWERAASRYDDRTEGHGRDQTRAARVPALSRLDLPHARQDTRATRHQTDKTSGKRTRQTAHAITNPPSHQARTRDQDRSRIRAGHRPGNTATPRDSTNATSMTEAVRDLSREPHTAPHSTSSASTV